MPKTPKSDRHQGNIQGWTEWVHPFNLIDFLFASQPERLIGLARLIFSCVGLLAIYLDPTQPARNVPETYGIQSTYIAYSAVLALISFRRTLSDPALYVIHAVDIGTLSVLVYFTDGLESPFFAFFTFTLLTATMRWSWRGAFATAAGLGVLLLIVTWNDLEISLDRDSELNLLILRSAYLFVSAAILGYFGAYRERIRDRLAKLAAWPIDAALQRANPPLDHSLRHAAEVLGAPKLLVLWTDQEEGVTRLAYSTIDSCNFSELEPSSAARLLALRPDGGARFFSADTKGGAELLEAEMVSLLVNQRSAHHAGQRIRSFCAASFESLNYEGTVFVIDPYFSSEDILSLTTIVASHIAAELERFALLGEVAGAAISRERIRLARDMHDSVLQDLTAASLLLKSAEKVLPGSVSEPLKEVSSLLLSQQRRIRSFVQSAKPKPASEGQALADVMKAFIEPLARQWRCDINVRIEPPDLHVDGATSEEVSNFLSEATANAVKHGGAGQVDVQVIRIDNNLSLCIRDNGQVRAPAGSPLDFEPYSIKARVAELGGHYTLVNSGRGVALNIEFPMSS